MNRPRLLDLFCGAGGCSAGYVAAGFDVVGVDNNFMPRYPYDFIQDDWESYLDLNWHNFDAIHASPPCQAYSITKNINLAADKYPKLIDLVRAKLQKTCLPYVIENVVGSPLVNPILLRGNMFGLKIKRDRLFESNCLILAPQKQRMCGTSGQTWGNRRDRPVRRNPSLFKDECQFISVAGHAFLVEEAKFAMGIDWMIGKELAQAIPPAYTEWIGRQLIRYANATIGQSDFPECP